MSCLAISEPGEYLCPFFVKIVVVSRLLNSEAKNRMGRLDKCSHLGLKCLEGEESNQVTVNDNKRGLWAPISVWLHKLAKLLAAEMRAQLSGIKRITAADSGSTATKALEDKATTETVSVPGPEAIALEDLAGPETTSEPAAEINAPEDEVSRETVSVPAAEAGAPEDKVRTETISKPAAKIEAPEESASPETVSEPAAEIQEPASGAESKAAETDQAWLMRTLDL